LKNGFERGNVDTTPFHKNYDSRFLLVQVYVNDIIFCATNEMLCKDFSKLIQIKFEMIMMGELEFFLGLQIKQTPTGIYLCSPNQVCEKIVEEIQHGLCKRNEDSNASYNIPWTGRGINKSGHDSI